MKKIFAVLLVSVMLFSLVACNSGNDQPEVTPYEGTLAELVDAIYEKNPVEMMVSPAIDIDITDSEALSSFLGITSAEGIEEAVFSEPMIGSQAYSLCLARVSEGADVAALKESILNNVDTRKWVCVGADQLIVGDCGNVIIMVMADSQLSETLAEDIYNAFVEITGTTSEKLVK